MRKRSAARLGALRRGRAEGSPASLARRAVVVATALVLVATGISIASVPSAGAVDPCNPVLNKIACENSLPGSPPSAWNVDKDGSPTIQGFATRMSVNLAETISFKINTNAAGYGIDIFRFGYYNGDGARRVASLSPSAALPQTQPSCLSNATTGLVDCGNWGVSAAWNVPGNAVSGVYEALLTRNDTGATSAIVFVVRDDSSHSNVLYQTSDATWQAYNNYGGNSLYFGTGPSFSGAAYKVSYNRPLLGRTNADYNNSFFTAEIPMVRFLERNGYDVSYFTNVDTDARGSLIQNHNLFMSSGHDEYWSANMRNNVTAARDAGVNLSFFSGNTMFWKTRYEASIDGSTTSSRTLVTYKETHPDIPASQVDPTGEWTGTWRDPRHASPPDGGWPENQIIGTLSEVNGTRRDAIKVPAAYKDLRMWRNTAIANLPVGGTYTMPIGTLGYEWDADKDNGFRPAGVIDLSSTSVTMSQTDINNSNGGIFSQYGHSVVPGTAVHNMTLYRAPSGAQVFSAASVQWSWGLDSYHDATPTPVDANMQQATVNLFADMGIQPSTLMSNLTLASKSVDTSTPTTTILSPTGGATVIAGQPTTISGTSADVGGGLVASVEVSTDSGASWHPATSTDNWATWSFAWTPSALGVVSLAVRGVDDSANYPSSPTTRSVTVSYACPCSLYNSNAVPQTSSTPDSNAIEVGVQFRSDVAGQITGIRFYKGTGNTGTHVGNLWSSTGTLLASATFTGETSTGWQQASFSSSVPITANTTYVASYFAPVGRYASQDYSFLVAIDNPPLHAPQTSTVANGNAVYRYNAGSAFPNQTYKSESYFVDVSFTSAAPPPADSTPPTVTSTTPANSATSVSTSVVASATFSEAVQSATVGFVLKAGSVSVAGTSAYNSATNTATFTPSAALAAATTYTATVSGVKDTAGNTIAAPSTWSFTTAASTSVTLGDTSVADFAAGTGSGTAVVQTADGEVALAPAAGDEFSGTTLPTGWTSTTIATGGTTTVGAGVLTLNGNRVNTSATFSAGRSLEFVATFRGENNQSVGLGSSLGSSTPYAVFGVSGGNLQAQTRTNNLTASSTGLGTTYLNAPHRFRVDWNTANISYSVDGVVVATHNRTLTMAMSLVARDSTTGAMPLIVDWIRLGPYPTTGIFTSRVLDAGQSFLYDAIAWTGDLPSGSTVAVEVRTGDTAAPDGTWTAFAAVTSGGSVGQTGRYAQYRVTLTRGTAVLTPSLNALSVIAHS